MRLEDLAIPEGLVLVRTTPEFDETTVPAGLLRNHRVAAGVWGVVRVRSGRIGFSFDDEPGSRRSISAGESQVIPPERPHHLVLQGKVLLAVEFFGSC
ncbi:MAG: tellurite resistance-related uncharacterized protein [Acidimicrobiales bacterium]